MSDLNIDRVTFDKLLETESRPVVVDFWAPWCGPCRMIAPLIEAAAASNEGVKIVKINVDDEPDLTARYNIQSIPTLAIFQEGELVVMQAGAVNKNGLDAFLARAVEQTATE